jgi:hypothetical protein
MKNGETFAAQADYALGEPELPMSMEDFCAKVTELGQYAGRTESDIQKIIDMVLTFDGKISDLMKYLA